MCFVSSNPNSIESNPIRKLYQVPGQGDRYVLRCMVDGKVTEHAIGKPRMNAGIVLDWIVLEFPRIELDWIGLDLIV